MKTKRFNKKQLLEDLRAVRSRINQEHEFTDYNGYFQVKGKGEPTNRIYGEWTMLRTVIEGIEGGYLGVGE